MVLAIDIGNKTTCIGLFRDNKLINPQRIPNNELFDIQTYLPQRKIDSVLISSVVPAKNEVFTRAIQGFYELSPIFIDLTYLKGAYPGMGADRVANLIGGKRLFGLPLCVVDFGTATTIDTLNSKGKYVGGIILPGIKSGFDILHNKTAILPKISFPTRTELPLLGKSTKECIESGAYWGEVFRIKGLLKEIKKTIEVKLVITGGLGKLFSKPLDASYEPWLTLWGLKFSLWKKIDKGKS